MITGRARLFALFAVIAAFTYAIFFLVGPTGTLCEAGPVSPGQTLSTMGPCRSTSTLQMGLSPQAIPFLAAWTLAPLLSLAGIGTGSRPLAIGGTAVALLVELTSVISIGGGFIYALLVAPLLALTLVSLLRTSPHG